MDERAEDFYEDIEETGGKECEDTYWAMPWDKFVDVVKKYGFEVGFHQEFNGEKSEVKEEEYIFYHKEKGLILYAESYYRSSVNHASVYGELKNDDNLMSLREYTPHINRDENEKGATTVHIDAREWMCRSIDFLSENFGLSPKWTDVPFLWFVNHMDIKKQGHDYKKINEQKLSQCTPEVREIIFGFYF